MSRKEESDTRQLQGNGGLAGVIVLGAFMLGEMALLRHWCIEVFNWGARNVDGDLMRSPPTMVGLVLVVLKEGWPVLAPGVVLGWLGFGFGECMLATAIGYAVSVTGGPLAGLVVATSLLFLSIRHSTSLNTKICRKTTATTDKAQGI